MNNATTRTVLASVALFCFWTPSYAAPIAHADDLPDHTFVLTCRIIYPNGKPAADATLFQDLLNIATMTVTTSAHKADKSGQVRLTYTPHELDMVEEILFCTSPNGVGLLQASPDGAPSFTFILRPFTSLRVHFVDRYEKPLSNLKVSVISMTRGTGLSTSGLSWDDKISGDWTQTTDASGFATFKHLPQGFSLQAGTGDNHYSSGAPPKSILLSKAARTPDTTITLARAEIISGTIINVATNAPIAGVTVEAKGSKDAGTAISDKNGKFTIGQLAAGDYRVAQVVGIDSVFHESAIPDWISDPQEIKIDNTADVPDVTLRLIHGGLITGKITDKTNGAPVAGVQVTETPAVGQTLQVERDIRSAVTASDGTYSLRVSPGKATLTIQPSTTTTLPHTQIEIHDGESKSVSLQIDASTYPFAGPTLATHGIEAYANSEIEVATDSSTSLLPPDDYEPVVKVRISRHGSGPHKRRAHRKEAQRTKD